jgi:hypothetical protein
LGGIGGARFGLTGLDWEVLMDVATMHESIAPVAKRLVKAFLALIERL